MCAGTSNMHWPALWVLAGIFAALSLALFLYLFCFQVGSLLTACLVSVLCSAECECLSDSNLVETALELSLSLLHLYCYHCGYDD